jgi:acetolactate synthase I/II/III large subunit
MKASDLLVQCLECEGVDTIYGVPGEENLDLLESIRTSSIRLVVTRHEQAAGFMAATHGRLTGRTGVCLSTLGPGATNFITAVAYAHLAGMPCLFLTGQKPIGKSKQGRFQILDVVGMMRPVTKLAEQIVDGNNIPSLVAECFRRAEREKPGPTHLELPEDVATEEVDRIPFVKSRSDPPGPSAKSLDRATRMIAEARHPLLLVAAGANRADTHGAVRKLVEKTGLYFCTTQMGKGVVDERHPRFLGTAALSDHDYLHWAIDHADLIINVGHDVSEKPPFLMRPDGARVIHVGFFPAQMDDVYFPQHEVVGCMATSMRALAERVQPSDRWDFSFFERVHLEVEHHVYGMRGEDVFPNVPQRIVADVREALPDDGILALDNGMYKIWFARNFRATEPNTVLLDNALATMGAGLPVAIGAKIAHPDRKVVAVCGDGGFMMSSQELETAVRLGLDLVVVVLRDDGYGMVKWKQADMGFEDYGLDFTNPDFVAYARSYGAEGHRIAATGELTGTLTRCFAQGGVHLVEVPIDYRENQRVLNEELREKTLTLSEHRHD